GDHLRARGLDRLLEDLQRAEAARAEDQPRLPRAPAQLQAHPPCTARRTSTRWPSKSRVDSHALRGTTAASTATATPRWAGPAPASWTTSATVAPSRTLWRSPFNSIFTPVRSSSLRRHDPDQVQTVGGDRSRPLSPLPGSRSISMVASQRGCEALPRTR